MAVRAVDVSGKIPAGTAVAAYLSREQPSGLTGLPHGSPVETAVASPTQVVTFVALVDDTEYVAYALVAAVHQYVAFRTEPAPPVDMATQAELDIYAGAETAARTSGDSGLNTRLLSVESGSGSVVVKSRTAYNAKDYGLLGDGSTSDQAAMTAMLPQIPAGSRLNFPRGTYLFSAGNLPPNRLEVVGDGQGATTLKVADGSTLAAGLLEWTNAEDVFLRDFTVDLNKANTPDGGADGAQMGLYFYTGAAGASRRNRVERVRVLNGERHGVVLGSATAGLPLEADLTDVDVEDCDNLGLFASFVTKCKVVRGNYLRSGLDNIQFLRSAGFTVEDVLAAGSLGGHGVVAGDMCSEFQFLGGRAFDNVFSGWVASVRCTAFQMLGQRARGNGQMGITVDVRNHDTTLTAAVTAAVATIPVASTADYLTSGVIRIDSEDISYTGLTSTSFTGCTRGAQGTVAASHLINAVVTSQTFHRSDGLIDGYLLSANGSHGLYNQFSTDLTIGRGACYSNTGDGCLLVAQRAAVEGLNAYLNSGRGLAISNSASGAGTGDHAIGSGCRLFQNVGVNYEDNGSDTSLADLRGVGTPEGVVKAAVGSTWRRKGGGAGTSFYVKETGTGASGWVGK